MPCACCDVSGACCVDGECQQADSEAACDELGGIFQGVGTTCDDGDCADTCCVPSVNDAGCPITICSPGYFFCNSPCYDPAAPQQPTTGFKECQSGTTIHNTVTGSGVTFNTGDAAYDAMLSDAMNASYSITRQQCDGTSSLTNNYSETFPLPDGPTWSNHYVIAYFPSPSYLYAGISVMGPGSPALKASMERNVGFRSDVLSSCGIPLYDCNQAVSGAPTTTGGYGDYTNADISTS